MNVDPATGDIACVDVTGRAITDATCAACDHAALRRQGGCKPGQACMRDAYARRIERFFQRHLQRVDH